MDGYPVAVLDFHDDIKCRRRFAFQYRLLRAPPPGFFVTQSYRLYPSDQVGQSRVHHQIVQRIAVSGTDQLDTPFSNRSCRHCLKLGTYLINNDYFGHVVFHSLYHHGMLQ